MNGFVAVGAGAGLGLAYFGGLWWTVVGVVGRPSRAVWVPVGGVARLVLLGLGLAILSLHGAANLLLALGGLWMARSCLLWRLGGVSDGR